MSDGTEFSVHILNEMGIAKAKSIQAKFEDLLFALEGVCPPGRERALVVTNLQTAAFWAKRGMAVQPENQKATNE